MIRLPPRDLLHGEDVVKRAGEDGEKVPERMRVQDERNGREIMVDLEEVSPRQLQYKVS